MDWIDFYWFGRDPQAEFEISHYCSCKYQSIKQWFPEPLHSYVLFHSDLHPSFYPRALWSQLSPSSSPCRTTFIRPACLRTFRVPYRPGQWRQRTPSIVFCRIQRSQRQIIQLIPSTWHIVTRFLVGESRSDAEDHMAHKEYTWWKRREKVILSVRPLQ